MIDCGGADGDATGHTCSPEDDFARVDVGEGSGVVEGVAVVAGLEGWIYLISGRAGAGTPISVVVEEDGVACFLETGGVVREEVFF